MSFFAVSINDKRRIGERNYLLPVDELKTWDAAVKAADACHGGTECPCIGSKCVIKHGWEGAGEEYECCGYPVRRDGIWWVPLIPLGTGHGLDPTWYKLSGLRVTEDT